LNLTPHRLYHKLILSLTLIIVLVGVISGIYAYTIQERQFLEVMMIGADQLSRSITSATWQAMLANQRQGVQEIMQTIALKQGINRLRIFNKDGRVMYTTSAGDSVRVDKRAEACALCHDSDKPLVKLDPHMRARIYSGPDGERKLAMVTPIYNEPSCSQAACHAHPEELKVLGVLDVTMDLGQVDEKLSSLKFRSLIVSCSQILLMALVVAFLTRRYFDTPVRKLADATRAVSAMELDKPVIVESGGELAELAQSFNSMREQLKMAFDEINEITQGLERRIAERSEQLKVTNQKLMQTDRLASLGQLAASVAHEINNPLSGVLNLSMLMQRVLKDDGIPPDRIAEFRRYLGQVTTETARVGRIVSDLLAFSRRSKPQRTYADLNAIIKSSINLLSHKLKLANADVRLELQEDLPRVLCDGSQIQQVVVNLVMNAADSLQSASGGGITISTKVGTPADSVRLVVSDTGEGIRRENLSRIFDPFFTTKGEGKGVGLGLAVVFGIVDSHGGDVDVQSTVGIGTTFTVVLPLQGASTSTGVDVIGNSGQTPR
jgi:two-component system NtrC family sensor kinase